MGFIYNELQITKKDFAEQLIEQSSDRIKKELDQFFKPVENLLLSLQLQSDLNMFDDYSNQEFNQFFIPIINYYPQISSVGIADSKGFELEIIPDSTNGWLNREVRVDEWGMIERWSLWDSREGINRTKSREKELKQDPRTRPWYTGVIQNNYEEIFWTEPYLYNTNNEVGLTASIKWNTNSDRRDTEILALDITLNDLKAYSKSISITKNNLIFFFSGEDINLINQSEAIEEINLQDATGIGILTPTKLEESALLSLLKQPANRIVSFENEGESWWGLVQIYSISERQVIQYAVLIPETDFSQEIDNTIKAAFGGFLIIILLASLLVTNHHRLRKAKNKLKGQNEIISNQKERLYMEVHHRVKNNLAIISALMELENMESNNKEVNEILTQTQRRVKSMSTVHEIMYKSGDINKVLVKEFIPEIISALTKNYSEQVQLKIADIAINVNQALSYALLLNEFIGGLIKGQLKSNEYLLIEIQQDSPNLKTLIKVISESLNQNTINNLGKELIDVLLVQLGAVLDTYIEDGCLMFEINFELKDKKGVASNF